MEHRKVLRKRKHLEEDPSVPSVEQEALSSSESLSEVSDTLDKDYKPGPGEETSSSSSPEERPEPLRRRICCLSSTSSTAAPSSSTTSTAAPSSSTDAASCSTTSRPPTRCTVYRRKKRAEKDRAVLAQAAADSSLQGTPGAPCDICGHPRHWDTGHAFYQGQFFCSLEDGAGGRTPQEWVAERRGPTDVSIPRTTLWRRKKAFDKEEEEEAAATSQPEGKKRKPHKLRICQRCGQLAQKDFGHSQLNRLGQKKEYFCALFEGKSLDLWLAERRPSTE